MRVSPETLQKTQLLLGVTPVGQGKRTFANILEPHLTTAGISTTRIGPENGNVLTRNVWARINDLYLAAGQPGWIQNRYDAIRSNAGGEGLLTRIANAELLDFLRTTNLPFLTVHGLWGKGAKRYFAEGDVHPEPLAADNTTTSFVPLPQTRDALKAKGTTGEIEVVGFMVPQQLDDAARVQKRIETLSQPEPTKERPLKLAFMMTGQLAHMDILQQQLLKNDKLVEWIKDGRAKLSVYLWTGQKEAEQVEKHGKRIGLNPLVTTTYQPYSEAIDQSQTPGLQIFWNSNPDEAVQGSFAMAADADVIITPLGERIGWTGDVPVVALPSVGRNPKMEENLAWTRAKGLVGPDEELNDITTTLVGDRIRTHFGRAQEVFPDREGLRGAEEIAARMQNVVNT
jgi:hypothetical protein